MSVFEHGLAVVVPAYNEEASLEGTLDALYRQNFKGDATHIVVNNASTDNTRGVAESFARLHDDFPLVVIDEPEKGTGSAADTGFRAAIGIGYPIIACTDADTLPDSNWSQIIHDNFTVQPALRLLGGQTRP
jgi:glycosyltransferase involved in cell wall biosynthesis